jgi:hypothetical protein
MDTDAEEGAAGEEEVEAEAEAAVVKIQAILDQRGCGAGAIPG